MAAIPKKTAGLFEYLNTANARASVDIEGKKKKKEEGVASLRLDQSCRYLENPTSPETKMASLPHCRDVTVGVSSSFRLAPLLRGAAGRWKKIPIYLE